MAEVTETTTLAGNGNLGEVELPPTTPMHDDKDVQDNSDLLHSKRQQCHLFRLLGDYLQMKKLGCDKIPNESHPLKTIPDNPGRGMEADNKISESLRYLMLAILLMFAVSTVLVCCCRMYSRIASRRAALEAQYGGNRIGMDSRFAPRTSCCGGGVGFGGQNSYRSSYLQGRKFGTQNTKMFGDECHNCSEELNLV